MSGVCGASGHHPPTCMFPVWGPQGPPSLLASALGCSCWGPRTYLGAAATGLSAEVKEVPALLQVQRPQVVLKHAPCEVLWEGRQVGSLQPALGTPSFCSTAERREGPERNPLATVSLVTREMGAGGPLRGLHPPWPPTAGRRWLTHPGDLGEVHMGSPVHVCLGSGQAQLPGPDLILGSL